MLSLFNGQDNVTHVCMHCSFLQNTSFSVVMGILASGSSKYLPNESASLRQAICAAAKMPESQAGKAVEYLKATDPQSLLMILKGEGLGMQVCLAFCYRKWSTSIGLLFKPL